MHSAVSFIFSVAVMLQAGLVVTEVSSNYRNNVEPLPLLDLAPSSLSLKLVKKYLRDETEFRNCTTDEEYSNRIVELMKWKPPKFILDKYPCYLSGFTEENNPVWVSELGKYDLVALMNEGPKMLAYAEKVIIQFIVLGFRSMEIGRARSNRTEFPRAVVIADYDGLRLPHINSITGLDWLLKKCLHYRLLAETFLEEAYLINVNFAVENLIQLAKPMVGHLLERIQVFGSVKSKWLPALAQRFPEEALPFKYGGRRNHKKLFTYG